MRTEFIVRFDGDADSLREHRLSIADFGQPLQLLLKALRRTASSMGAQIEEGESYGDRGGRFTRMADGLDLQIAKLEDGCVQLVMDCVHEAPARHTADMWFTEHAVSRLLEDLEHEAKGTPRNGNARKYLRSLPPYVSAQRYTVRTEGGTLREVSIGTVRIPDLPTDPPRVTIVVGTLAGLGMEDGKESVTIKSAEGRVTASASADLVERAISMRHEEVRATVLDGAKPRLLRIDPRAASGPSPAARLALINTHWADALAELAK